MAGYFKAVNLISHIFDYSNGKSEAIFLKKSFGKTCLAGIFYHQIK